MPDPTRETISATEAPALFHASPYFTRWMLWQKFANDMPLDQREPDARMVWGKKLQPLIIAQAAEDLRLEVHPNDGDVYHRRGLLGCTRDATIICPDRGPGALETKCVFDYRTWMADWAGGASVPRHYEIQLQQQMLVGDASGSYRWGIVAAWVAGDVHYFERGPIPQLWSALNAEASAFFADVKANRAPPPFGDPVEIPWLKELFPLRPLHTVTLDDQKLQEVAIAYRDAKEQEAAGARTAEPLRAKLLAAAQGAGEIELPDNVRVRFSKAGGNGVRIKVYVPEPGTPADLLMAG